MFGTARDAVELFEEIQGVPMADSSYRDAIARYLYLGEREKALQTAERLATSRLWAVAGPTQVRPMSVFEMCIRDSCGSAWNGSTSGYLSSTLPLGCADLVTKAGDALARSRSAA